MKLGEPLLTVEVSDGQADHVVDDAIQVFREYHQHALARTFFKYEITQTDIDNRALTIPDNIWAIYRVFPVRTGGVGSISDGSDTFFNIEYQLRLNDLLDLRYLGNLQSYVQTRQYLSLLDLTINGAEEPFRWSKYENRVYLDDIKWDSNRILGKFIIVEAAALIDPDQNTRMWNDMWLKAYAVALMKYQWGSNLTKISGMKLIGGIEFSGREILEDAKTDIEVLMERARKEFQAPPMVLIG